MIQMRNGEHQDCSSFPALGMSAVAYAKESSSIYCRLAVLKVSISAHFVSLLPLSNCVEVKPQLLVFGMTSLVTQISLSLENNFQLSQFKRSVIFFITAHHCGRLTVYM